MTDIHPGIPLSSADGLSPASGADRCPAGTAAGQVAAAVWEGVQLLSGPSGSTHSL